MIELNNDITFAKLQKLQKWQLLKHHLKQVITWNSKIKIKCLHVKCTFFLLGLNVPLISKHKVIWLTSCFCFCFAYKETRSLSYYIPQGTSLNTATNWFGKKLLLRFQVMTELNNEITFAKLQNKLQLLKHLLKQVITGNSKRKKKNQKSSKRRAAWPWNVFLFYSA